MNISRLKHDSNFGKTIFPLEDNVIFDHSKLLYLLALQSTLNDKVADKWADEDFQDTFVFHTASLVEIGEALTSYGYKWWKQQTPDMENVKLEVVDILHFVLSACIRDSSKIDGVDSLSDLAQLLIGTAAYDIDGSSFVPIYQIGSMRTPQFPTVLQMFEQLAFSVLVEPRDAFRHVLGLMQCLDMSADEAYRIYIGKNALNTVRADFGYKSGTYIKNWKGREDNYVMLELVVNNSNIQKIEDAYAILCDHYKHVSEHKT